MSNEKKADNQRFVQMTDHLMRVKKISLEDMATSLKVDRLKIANIRSGRSSADRFMMANLQEAYTSELSDYQEPNAVKESPKAEKNRIRIERLEKEVAQLTTLLFDNLKRISNLEEKK